MNTPTRDELYFHPSRSRPGGRYATCGGALFTDRLMLDLHGDRLDKAATSHDPLFFSGEAGTGKRLLARTAYSWSWVQGPLVQLDCLGAPERLEAQLFGDPAQGVRGAIGEARPGSLLLSNIDYLPLPLQARLDPRLTRFLYTSRASLTTCFRAGRLHTRVAESVLGEFVVPPLRERADAVPELFAYFVHQMGPRGRPGGWTPPVPEASATERLLQRRWPGNVVELRAVVFDVLLNGREGPIGPSDLRGFEPDDFSRPGDVGARSATA